MKRSEVKVSDNLKASFWATASDHIQFCDEGEIRQGIFRVPVELPMSIIF